MQVKGAAGGLQLRVTAKLEEGVCSQPVPKTSMPLHSAYHCPHTVCVRTTGTMWHAERASMSVCGSAARVDCC